MVVNVNLMVENAIKIKTEIVLSVEVGIKFN